MAKPWKEVISSPQYQALSSEQKAQAQEQYFNDVVAPKAGNDAESAKAQFYLAYPLSKSKETTSNSSNIDLANSDIPTDEVLAYHAQQQANIPRRAPTYWEQLVDGTKESGRMVAQAGANTINIVPELADALNSGAIWAANQVGIGDGKYETRAPRLQLPDEAQPKTDLGKMGAEVLPYLIPLVGPEKAASIIAASSTKGERVATRLADMAQENVVGALAQNSSKDPQSQTLNQDFGLGVAGSGAARAITPLLKMGYGAVTGKLGREGQQVAQQTSEQAAREVPNTPITPQQHNNTPFSGKEERGTQAINDHQLDNNIADVMRPLDNNRNQSAKPNLEQSITPPTNTVSPEKVATEDALRSLAAQKKPDLANSLDGLHVDINPEIKASADRLGLTDNLLPSHMSGNQQYIEVEQAIKSRTGSALNAQENQAILSLSKRAGKLIDEISGAPDALSLNQKLIGQFDDKMKALEMRSNHLYSQVDDALPLHTRVEAHNTSSALEREADNLGGWDNLDPIQKKVFKAVNPGEEGILTYANLNKQRRLVGQALHKNRGPYKDADERALKLLYRNLSEDQRAILGETEAGRDFEIAQRLVQMRKNMEEQMVSLRGENLTGDIANKGSLAVAALAKGDSKRFIELMRNLPTRQMRQEVAATSIRDMLSASKRGADFNPGGFADWYQNLIHTGNIRILSRHLPKSFMNGLRDVYNVAKGIQKARVYEIKTGKLNEFTKRFDAVTQQYEIAAKYADKVGMVIGSKFGPLGTLAGDTLGKKVADKARRMGGSESSLAADKLLSSPEFQEAAKGVKQPVPNGVKPSDKVVFDEPKLRTSKVWRDFYHSLPENEKRMIARMGFIWWANQDDEGQ